MVDTPHSDTTTEGIRIQAAAQYLPGDSDPDASLYAYTYRIVITNEGDARAKLMARHWVILDADGVRKVVSGPGVVGEFPDLAPGESFTYYSTCPLPTQWGTMEGAYTMKRDDGSTLNAKIGRFFLVPSAPPIEQLQ